MRLTPPKKLVFWISVILAVVGLIGQYVDFGLSFDAAFYLVLVGYILLFLGNTVKGF